MEENRIKELEQRPFAKVFPKAIDDIKNNVCPHCGAEITELRDASSEKEYTISGLCQDCQDRVFGV